MKTKEQSNQTPEKQVVATGEENTGTEDKSQKLSEANDPAIGIAGSEDTKITAVETPLEDNAVKPEKEKVKKKPKAKAKKKEVKKPEVHVEQATDPGAEVKEESVPEESVSEDVSDSQPIEASTTEQSEAPVSEASTEIIEKKSECPEPTAEDPSEPTEKAGQETKDTSSSESSEAQATEKVEEKIIDYNSLSQEELVAMLELIVQEDEVTQIRNKVALIKVAYLKLQQAEEEKQLENFLMDGGDKINFTPNESALDNRFNSAFKVYSRKRKAFLVELEKEKKTNLEAKKIILEELKALIESEESLKKTYDDFRGLQDKWKKIGMVPKADVNNLWQSYHFLVEKFFDKVKINRELRDLDMKKNLESKIGLCEKAEELLLGKSVTKSFKELQHLHSLWKEIGPVPHDKKEELWERFKGVSDKINSLRREHYNTIKEEQQKNYLAKTALCEKAEELLKKENNSIKDWQQNTDEINALLKVWKTLGSASRGLNDEIGERFRNSLDTFFGLKKEFYQKIKEEQNNNYNLKLNLCVQAEALKDSTDWKGTTHELINLQKEWKSIGPAPRKYADKIWKRFRAACDEFFNNKSEYYSHIKDHEKENLEQKRTLISEVESFEFSEDKKENLNVIKDFQRKFTEIGHVPFKEKEHVHNDFRTAINKQLDKLNIKRTEIQAINFKQKFENLKDNPNAGRIINSERIFLVQKKKKLEEEAQLLENNMGFLAKSAKADLLKQEFEKKIEKARNEIVLIGEKIKFLDQKN